MNFRDFSIKQLENILENGVISIVLDIKEGETLVKILDVYQTNYKSVDYLLCGVMNEYVDRIEIKYCYLFNVQVVPVNNMGKIIDSNGYMRIRNVVGKLRILHNCIDNKKTALEIYEEVMKKIGENKIGI